MNPWVILGVAVMWGLSLFAVGKWQRTDGATAERVAWQAKDNEELRLANAKILELGNAARAQERKHVEAMAALGADYEKKLADAKAQSNRDRASIRDGALKLRIATERICPGGGAASEAGSTPGERDGPATVELPQQITSDLFDLANDADQVADQLRACQGVIQSDRSVSQ